MLKHNLRLRPGRCLVSCRPRAPLRPIPSTTLAITYLPPSSGQKERRYAAAASTERFPTLSRADCPANHAQGGPRVKRLTGRARGRPRPADPSRSAAGAPPTMPKSSFFHESPKRLFPQCHAAGTAGEEHWQAGGARPNDVSALPAIRVCASCAHFSQRRGAKSAKAVCRALRSSFLRVVREAFS